MQIYLLLGGCPPASFLQIPLQLIDGFVIVKGLLCLEQFTVFDQ